MIEVVKKIWDELFPKPVEDRIVRARIEDDFLFVWLDDGEKLTFINDSYWIIIYNYPSMTRIEYYLGKKIDDIVRYIRQHKKDYEVLK